MTLPKDLPQPLKDEARGVAESVGVKLQEESETTESLARYSEGDVVDTPSGLGVVTEIETESFEGPDGTVEASSDSPVYVVGVEDASVGVGFYKASELSEGEMPDTGLDDPTEALHATTDGDIEALNWDNPESWEDAAKPARLIALDAWQSMGASFTGARKELGSNRLAASFKDYILGGWTGWRSGGESMSQGAGTGNGKPFSTVPVLPSDLENLTKPWLVRWAEWIAAGRPAITSASALSSWNPALHPRDPRTGQFVERPFNIPDDMPDFGSQSPGEILGYLDEQGEDVSSILDPDSGVTIDGVPNDATSVDDIPESGETSDFSPDISGDFDDETAAEIQESLSNYIDSYNVEDAQERLRNGITAVNQGAPRAGSVGARESEISLFGSADDVAHHEASHSLVHVYGSSNGAYPGDDKTGAPSHPWEDENRFVDQVSALRDRQGDLIEGGGVYGLDEWSEEIEQATPDLSEGSFDSLNGESEAATRLTTDVGEGALIRTPEPLPREERFGVQEPEPAVYRVASKETAETPDGDTFRADITLEDATGEEITVTAYNAPGAEPRIEYPDLESAFAPEPDGIKPEGVDGFDPKGRTPDPDDVLGQSDLEGNEAIKQYFSDVNRAWYRQATTGREYSEKVSSQMTLGTGHYSAHNAGETIARLNEAMESPDVNHGPAAAHALVNYHPDLLESLRNVRDIPDGFKQQLDKELEAAGAEYRFGGS